MISVCECIAPIQKISAVFGLLLTRVVKENGKLTIQFSKLHILLPATYLVITTLLLYDLILTSPAVAKSKYGVGVMYIGMLFIFIGNITALYTITFTNAVVSAAIADVIDKISRIDELMKIMINKIDYKSHFKYEICMISSGLVIVLAEIILHFITFNAEQKLLNERLLFLFAFPVIIRIILEFQYVIFIKLLHERFALVNRELYNLFGYKSGSDKQYNMISVKTIQNCNWKGFSVWTNGESKCDTQLRSIQILMKLHDALTETGHKISRIFSLQILVCFAIHLICEVFIIFYASFEIAHHHYVSGLHWLGWLITINVEMLQITAICHQTTNEANRSVSVINKLFLVTQLKKTVKEKLFIFSQQICHRPLRFSACALFTIDGGLLFMVTCASATYLLVMFQYQYGIELQCLSKNNT